MTRAWWGGGNNAVMVQVTSSGIITFILKVHNMVPELNQYFGMILYCVFVCRKFLKISRKPSLSVISLGRLSLRI